MVTNRNALIAGALIGAALFFVMSQGTAAQPPAAAPGPSTDCFSRLLNLSDCLTYVEAGSKLMKPDKGCCPELAGLVDSQPICLCQLLGNTGSLGFQIDVNRALKLPSVCSVNTPPASMCSAVGVPVAVPMASEGSAPLGAMSPDASASIPAAGSNDSKAPKFAASDLSFLVGLASAFLTIFF